MNEVKRHDLIYFLLELRKTFPMTVTEMASESFIFYTGGFETSSSALSFCLYELALNQHIQDKLRLEIQDGLEETDGKITYDLLFRYEYLDLVVKETLRKYPVIPAMLRKCTKDYKIPDSELLITKGTNILLPFYSIHHDSDYYPDPEKFDPERFCDENVRERHSCTFLAFGEGPRGCIGARFGLLEVKLALVKLLSNFIFRMSNKTTIPLKFIPSAPFLAVDGIWLQVNRLEQQNSE